MDSIRWNVIINNSLAGATSWEKNRSEAAVEDWQRWADPHVLMRGVRNEKGGGEAGWGHNNENNVPVVQGGVLLWHVKEQGG